MLPPLPNDFFGKLALLRSQKMQLKEFSESGGEYWLQPEVYPHFEDYAIGAMLSPPEGKWGARGYAVYPSDFSASLEPSESVETVVFFRTSWLVESYQGIRLDYAVENLTYAPQGFENAFQMDISPQEFLLGPAYPVFTSNWAERVKIKVNAGNAPPGEYLVSFTTVKPFQSEVWSASYPAYFDGGGVGLSRPFFKIRLVVKS